LDTGDIVMNEENDILISRYLAADMVLPELAAFEARLAAEPALAAELQRRKEELTFFRTEAALPDLEAQMATLATQHFQSAPESELGQEAWTQVQGQGQNEQCKQGDQTAQIRTLNWECWRPATGIAAAVARVLLHWNPFSTDSYQQFALHAPLYFTENR